MMTERQIKILFRLWVACWSGVLLMTLALLWFTVGVNGI